jgi:hypothetical protein
MGVPVAARLVTRIEIIPLENDPLILDAGNSKETQNVQKTQKDAENSNSG